ncbi:MAG TPA: histidine phosphatase family protein [Streptosporangiaceae bacterium]
MPSRFLYLVRHGEAAGPEGGLSDTGQEQARRTGERLKNLPVTRIHHSPLPRAAQTARLIAGWLPGVPVAESAVVGDYIPADLDPAGLRPSHARLVSSYTVTDRKEGAALAQAAVERFARPPGDNPAGPAEPPAGRGTGPAADVHELIVTHNFLISWFVRHALDAPDWRWMGLNQQNCALTVILYQPGLPPSLVSFNDAAHLPDQLRWTGFPAPLRPGCG